MGLFDWLSHLFGGGESQHQGATRPDSSAPEPVEGDHQRPHRHRPIKLAPFRYRPSRSISSGAESVPSRPYRFGRPAIQGGWLDLSRDQNEGRLERFQLPQFRIPEELAHWLDIPLGQLAWLVHRFDEDQRPAEEGAAHYVYCWIKKAARGDRASLKPPNPNSSAFSGRFSRRFSIWSPPTRRLTAL